MAYSFPEGSSFQFSSTFAAAKIITALSNANPAVAACTAHGYATNDEVLISSGWEDATDSVWRITVIDANSFSIQGLDSSNTAFFPTGNGVGSAQKVSGWTTIPQILTISTSGGDPKFTDVAPLAKRNAIKIPTGFNAVSVTLSLGFDNTQVNYQAMVGISRALTKVALKQSIAGGASTYGYGYLNVSEFPKLNNNQVNAVDAAITMIGRSISY